MIVSGADGRGSAGTGAGLLLRVRVCASRQLRAFELLPQSPEPVCVTGLASLRMARKHGVGWSCGRAAAWQRLSAANALLANWGACGMDVCRRSKLQVACRGRCFRDSFSQIVSQGGDSAFVAWPTRTGPRRRGLAKASAPALGSSGLKSVEG